MFNHDRSPMMDRLAELKGDDIDLEKGEQIIHDTNLVKNSENSNTFFEEVNQIKTQLTYIKQNIETIEETYGRFITSVTNDQFKKVNAQLDALITETNELTIKVRDMLQIQKVNTASTEAGFRTQSMPEHPMDAVFRMRNNMHNMLTMRFLDLITEYQTVKSVRTK